MPAMLNRRFRGKGASLSKFAFPVAVAAILLIGALLGTFIWRSSAPCGWKGLTCSRLAPILVPIAANEPACIAAVGSVPSPKETGYAEASERAAAACRTSGAEDTAEEESAPARLALAQNLAEYTSWRSARVCASGVSACGSLRCYDDYLSGAAPGGAHYSEGVTLRAQAEEACRASEPLGNALNGRYLARSQGGCGTKPASVSITIKGGGVSWRHEFQGVLYSWSGAIDSAGHIRASVANSSDFTASGLYSQLDRTMNMKYPQCETPISMTVISKLAD